MTHEFLFRLRARQSAIEQQWRTLLAIEPVWTPLANPQTLQYLIPTMCHAIFEHAAKLSRSPSALATARAHLPDCNCGNNPYRAFFIAGEQALTEAAIVVQAQLAAELRKPRDLTALIYVIRGAARSEIDAFCGACVHRYKAANCRFAVTE